MSLIGKTLSSCELRERWLYADLASSRHGAIRLREMSDRGLDLSDLADKRTSHVAFEQLSAAERQRLNSAPIALGLMKSLADHPHFRCEEWSKAQVAQTWVVPALDPRRLTTGHQSEIVPYLTFFGHPVATDANGRPEPTDPKYQADQVRLGHEPPLRDDDALIVILHGHKRVLLDGTFRSILFMRSLDPNATIPVWVPLHVPTP